MSIEIIAKLKAKNNGEFALLDDIDLKGGYRIVNNLTERNSIPNDKRKAGMKVAVISTDIVYKLNNDLVTWDVDKTETLSLQEAYNNGSTIITTSDRPVVIQTEETNLTSLFEIKDNIGNKILSAKNDAKIDFYKQLRGKEYTSSISATIPTNSLEICIDMFDKLEYRALQYFYTVSNSDNSGYETGQIFVVHNGLGVVIECMVGSAIGVPCGISFSVDMVAYNINLRANTDNSGEFSRIINLLRIALI